MDFLLIAFALFVFSFCIDWKKAPGLLYLLAIPLAIITLPLRWALEILGWKKRR